MIRIPVADGTYELECDSNGTYHEIVAKLYGTFAAKASVSILRLGSSQVELLNSLPVDVNVVSSGLIFGSLEKVFVAISEASGYAEVTSREFGVPDNMSRSRAYVQSIAREYPAGVAQTGPLYSYVAANTAKAHVKVG